jgi:bifunctional non-homologous end joining protein LigD
MPLDEYRRKRNFDVTSEPAPRVAATVSGRSFVVQKHAASRLHYDFRLELDGVLKSWSVPKGPCFDPAAKRLAVQVEDHPIDYGGFEGIIPAGQYGGGTVLLWDRGTWTPVGDAEQGLAKGHLKFELFGEKLRGRWALVHMKPRPHAGGKRDDERNWLLIKDRDQHARAEAEWSVTVARPESVASGRDLPKIAAASDRVWHSDRGRADASALSGAKPGSMPAWIAPAQAKTARAVPDGDQWLHEIAIQGERVLARVEAGRVQFLGADGADRTAALSALVPAVLTLPVGHALLDCMATALDADGHTSTDRPADTLFALDLLYLDGYHLGQVALAERKQLLATLVAQSQPVRDGLRRLHFADHVSGRGRETFVQACSLGAPGIVSKRIDSRYPPAASAWRMVACPTSHQPKGKGQRKIKDQRKGQSKDKDQPKRAEPAQEQHHGRDLRVSGVKLTHPDRLLYPAVGLTKLALAEFYQRVSERMLPYLVDRPLTLIRGPNGMAGQRFYVRHPGDWAPSELRQLRIDEGTGSGTAMLVDDVRGLLALAQMNVLEIHPWNSRTRELEQPDRFVLDLDPGPEVGWGDVIQGAKHVRDVLATLDLVSFVKTTGGKGLHVVVPLSPGATWADTLEFSHLIAQGLARFEPTRFSAGLAKAPRTSKIFVDYLRNRRGATAVSAYSSRAQPTATVSVPVAWDRLDAVTGPGAFHIGNVDAWYGPTDPWADYGKIRQRLTASKLKAASAALERASS